MTIVRNCVRKTVKKDGPAKILCFFWDGSFDMQLTRTGHEFYGIPTSTALRWDSILPQEDFHQNMTLLPATFSQLKHGFEFDFILCNERIKQYDMVSKFSNALHLPIVIVDHSAPLQQLTDSDIHVLKQTRKAMKFVSCNQHCMDTWGGDVLIKECVNPIEPVEERTIDVLLAGKFVEQEYGIIQMATGEFDNVTIMGHNPGLSEEFKDWDELAEAFASSKIFINLATNMAISRNLRLAMEAGCAIITNKTQTIESVLGKDDALFVKNAEDIPPAIKRLLSNTKEREELSEAAKKAAKQFSIEPFVEGWNQLIEEVRSEIYIK